MTTRLQHPRTTSWRGSETPSESWHERAMRCQQARTTDTMQTKCRGRSVTRATSKALSRKEAASKSRLPEDACATTKHETKLNARVGEGSSSQKSNTFQIKARTCDWMPNYARATHKTRTGNICARRADACKCGRSESALRRRNFHARFHPALSYAIPYPPCPTLPDPHYYCSALQRPVVQST